MPPPIRRIAAALLALALVAGCGGGGDPDAGAIQDEPKPDWVVEVVPPDDSSTAAVNAVEVDHTISDPDEAVRLLIDGVDVTAYFTETASDLRYESGAGPVLLDPGEYTATVQRTTVDFEGPSEVLDSWSWSFRIQ